jgi:hypothetical protein
MKNAIFLLLCLVGLCLWAAAACAAAAPPACGAAAWPWSPPALAPVVTPPAPVAPPACAQADCPAGTCPQAIPALPGQEAGARHPLVRGAARLGGRVLHVAAAPLRWIAHRRAH